MTTDWDALVAECERIEQQALSGELTDEEYEIYWGRE